MQDTVIGDNAECNYIITDKNVNVGANRMLISSPMHPLYAGKGASL
jgi:glucose-1-phosphate adenylyltransferase